MKKKWIIGSIILCMLLLAGCQKKEEEAIQGSVIYYLNLEGTGLVAEEYKFQGENLEEKVENILSDMKNPKDPSEHKSAFPETVSIEKWILKDAVLQVCFSPSYADMKKSEEVLLRAAIVQSVTQMEEINYLSFYVGDETVKDSEGNEIGYQSASDFVQNVGSSLHSYQEVELKLYFADEKGEKLQPEINKERYNSNISIEKLIVEKLLEGPETEGYQATFFSDTKVLSVSVKDQICYVNFDEAFLKQPAIIEPKLAIYSLVNSIIEGGNVTSVQILVNGETNIKYQEVVDLSKPLSRNLDIIGEIK